MPVSRRACRSSEQAAEGALHLLARAAVVLEPEEREAILFQLVGQDGGCCLRPEQFTGAAWGETPDRDWPGSYRRELVIQLGRVEVTVEEIEENI